VKPVGMALIRAMSDRGFHGLGDDISITLGHSETYIAERWNTSKKYRDVQIKCEIDFIWVLVVLGTSASNEVHPSFTT